MKDVLSPVCPFCGGEPHAAASHTQWFCGTDGCPCLMWNPRVTPAENRRDAGPIQITDNTRKDDDR